MAKCVDEIQDGKHVVPALKHLGHMAHCIVHGNSSYFKPNKVKMASVGLCISCEINGIISPFYFL